MNKTPDPRRRQLRRMQWLALGLLATALGLLGLSHAMGAAGPWAWVRAGAEAAAVGALADWFAVVALFRHPLGLPIPHTALIPNSKDRIADSLAAFVRDHFLAPAMLLEKLAVFDPARRLGEWLSDAAHVQAWAGEGRAWVLGALDTLDDQRMQAALLDLLKAQAGRWDAARSAGDVLGLLTEGGRHHALMDAGLHQASQWLDTDEVRAKVADLLHKHIRQEYPKLVGMLGAVVGIENLSRKLADRIGAAALSELGEVLDQPAHPLRLRYEAWLQDYIGRLHQDPDLRRSVDDLKTRALNDPRLAQYVGSLWTDLKQSLRADLLREDSAFAARLQGLLQRLGRRLAGDDDLRTSINEHIQAGAGHLVTHLRSGVTDHIAQTIKSWDNRQLVRELELSVGADLQYIRMSGTVVGAVAGLLLQSQSLFY